MDGRWQNEVSREDAYYLGVSDALAQLRLRGIITGEQQHEAYNLAPEYADKWAGEDEGDAEDPGPPVGITVAFAFPNAGASAH